MRRLLLPSLVFAAVCLTGCSTQTPSLTPVGHENAQGSVYGGQQPVSGATIQLYTVNTAADGGASTPLLTQTVTTRADGTFTLSGLYSCSSATLVYLTATGGNPGLSSTNPNLAMMTALGSCSSLSSSSFITVNELTTVAATSALAPYMSSLKAVGASPADTPSLTNAFALASEYVNPATGASPGQNVPSGYTVPTAELNTLADILASCVNSTGGAAGDSTPCGQLFSLTTPAGATLAPGDTVAALLNVANYPTLNTASLFNLGSAQSPFQPQLMAAPSSFAVSLASSTPPQLQVSSTSITFPATTVHVLHSCPDPHAAKCRQHSRDVRLLFSWGHQPWGFH